MSPAIFHIVDTFEHDGQLRYEFDEVHAAGGNCTVGSDWPVTETPNLLPALASIVERITVDPTQLDKSQAPSFKTKTPKEIGGEILCRLITLGSAELLGKGHETGSIEPGKRANFIQVDHDLSKGEFLDAHVLKTWFEGELVWDMDGEFRLSV